MRIGPLAAVAIAAGGVLVGAACASAPAAAPPRDPLAAIFAAGPLAGAQWGVLAVDLATGDTLFARAAATRFLPASTMKIATSIAALDLLGPDYRWSTDLWSSAPIDSVRGVLAGDLVVPGTGDPSLSRRFHPADAEPLAVLGAALRDLGVRRVTGALVVDASAWDSTTVRASWMADDLPFAYGATGGAFVLNEGETHVELRAGAAAGDPVAFDWWPKGEDGFVRSRVTTGSGGAVDVVASYLPESRVLELTGAVPANTIDTLAFATRDPVRQSAAALHRSLAANGTAVEGGWRVAWEPGGSFGPGCTAGAAPPCAGGRRLGGLLSPTLLEVVDADLGPSQNWIAEQIVRTAAPGPRASWARGIEAASRALIERAGVDSLDLRMVDGSGLSTQDLLTPRALVAMLRHAGAQPWSNAFRAALPMPGERGSTLETRLLDLRGRLAAKTGTLTNVAALAGYLTDARGRDVAFAVMINASNLPGAASRAVIDDVVRMIAAAR